LVRLVREAGPEGFVLLCGLGLCLCRSRSRSRSRSNRRTAAHHARTVAAVDLHLGRAEVDPFYTVAVARKHVFAKAEEGFSHSSSLNMLHASTAVHTVAQDVLNADHVCYMKFGGAVKKRAPPFNFYTPLIYLPLTQYYNQLCLSQLMSSSSI
jgi:hypothetical protein